MPSQRQFSLRYLLVVVTLFAVALGVLVKPTGRHLAMFLFGHVYAFGPLLAVSFADPLGPPLARRCFVLWFLITLFLAGAITVALVFPEDRFLAIGSLAIGTIVIWTGQYALWHALKWTVEYCFPSLKHRKDAAGH